MEKKKMGRPTDSLKDHEAKARIDENLYQLLCEYARLHNINKAEVVRLALVSFLQKQ